MSVKVKAKPTKARPSTSPSSTGKFVKQSLAEDVTLRSAGALAEGSPYERKKVGPDFAATRSTAMELKEALRAGKKLQPLPALGPDEVLPVPAAKAACTPRKAAAAPKAGPGEDGRGGRGGAIWLGAGACGHGSIPTQ